MREMPSHPPKPGIRRKVYETRLEQLEQQNEFRARIDTINRCGLAAEVTVDGNYIHLYATRRVRTIKGE
jgi:hypothetical protein